MLRKILALLSPRERRRGLVVLVMVIVMALLETAGVASVMPFLTVLGTPEVVHTNRFLAATYDWLGFTSVDTFLMALGVAAFATIVFSALFRALTHYVMNRYIEMRRHSIGQALLEVYLRQPYAFFLNRHSGDLSKSILSEVDQLVATVFRPGVQMVAYSVVALAIVTLMVVVDPTLALGVAIVIGGLYAAIFLTVRGVLARVGRERVRANRMRFTTAGEAIGGIKDIKLLGREHAYLSRYKGPSQHFARSVAISQTLAQAPRFLIEAVGFGGVIALMLVLIATQGGVAGGGLQEILPVLGLYVFAAYRLLPAAQNIYQGAAQIRFGSAAVNSIHDDFTQRAVPAEVPHTAPEPMRPRGHVALEGVSYTYPNAQSAALTQIDLSIPVGSSVGLVGGTGAGKTTLVDLLLGLLRPSQGTIAVDGKPVDDKDLRAWQQTLGYVPQEIFLTDSSVAENIALGMPADCIDHDQVVRCAKMAQVHAFIMDEMPNEYDTIVGERGVRLSGGQRQRIGIARALYHDPAILVFDEATSALDTVTEKAVMEAIEALTQEKTIILIAHRLSTVKKCDRVVLLDKGRTVAAGRFGDLEHSDARFREMVQNA